MHDERTDTIYTEGIFICENADSPHARPTHPARRPTRASAPQHTAFESGGGPELTICVSQRVKVTSSWRPGAGLQHPNATRHTVWEATSQVLPRGRGRRCTDANSQPSFTTRRSEGRDESASHTGPCGAVRMCACQGTAQGHVQRDINCKPPYPSTLSGRITVLHRERAPHRAIAPCSLSLAPPACSASAAPCHSSSYRQQAGARNPSLRDL
jgi:hypothetical protein